MSGRRRVRTTDARKRYQFQLGDEIEFLSGEDGGKWKRGTVDRQISIWQVRIRVGCDGVCVIRSIKKCRKVE